MAKLMVEGGATVSGTDYTLRDITRVATSNTKMTEVFSGSIVGGASTTLDVTKVKRYLQISVRTYYNYSTFVIDTAGRNVVYGGSTEMAEDGVNSYYTVGVCYNRTTGVFTVNNIGYFQINSTSYTSRNNNSAYCVYKIDTFDETYTDTTDYVMVPKDSTITALTSALNRIETLGQLYYPVGSIYMSVNNVNPSLLFGGTWQKIEDRMLLGSGSRYTLGATGGKADTLRSIFGLTGTSYGGLSGGSGGGAYNGRIATVDGAHANTQGSMVGFNYVPDMDFMSPYLVVNIWYRVS